MVERKAHCRHIRVSRACITEHPHLPSKFQMNPIPDNGMMIAQHRLQGPVVDCDPAAAPALQKRIHFAKFFSRLKVYHYPNGLELDILGRWKRF